MKKIFVFFSFILLLQLVSAQCVVCDNNSTVSTSSTVGLNSTSMGAGSVSIGSNAHTLSTALNSIAIGSKVETVAGLSMVFGSGPYTTSGKLSNSISNSLMIGFNSQYPTLFVSPPYQSSPNYTTTGRIGIWNMTDPEAKLHLKADAEETAAIFIQPNNWMAGESANLLLGTTSLGISSDYSRGFVFNSANDYLFKDGKMGIGAFSSNEPEAKLHVKSSSGEEASIFIEPYRDDLEGGIEGESAWTGNLYLGTKTNIISGVSGLGLLYSTSQYHAFQGGNVGIGTLEPVSLFHIEDQGGTFKYDNANIAIYGKDNISSMSFNTSHGFNWNIANQSNNKTLYFKYGLSDKMGISSEDGLFVDERVVVCDMSIIPISQIPTAGIQVIQSNDANKKSAEYITEDGHKLFFVPHLSNSGYSPISTSKDAGIFWSDGLSTTGNQNDQGGLVIAAHQDAGMNGVKIDASGNVGIGTNDPTEKLEVNGKVIIHDEAWIEGKVTAEEIEVKADVWRDFVFYDSYKLKPLNEVEAFIKKNKHLPDVPSEAQVLEEGINLGEMDAVLLQKIEELTLYIIEQEKRIEELEKKCRE
jgi:hypothetical protein